MRQVDLVFVVCTYGSHEDLLNFIDSVNELNVKSAIVVANSFCSEETHRNIQKNDHRNERQRHAYDPTHLKLDLSALSFDKRDQKSASPKHTRSYKGGFSVEKRH